MRRLLATAVALGLSGCIAVGAIDRRAITVNDQVGMSQNQFVLLNLARASREEPVYFLAFDQLGASGTTDFRVGIPQVVLGPSVPVVNDVDTINPGGSTYLDNQTNSNFQMSLLNSRDFYSGLLAPLDLRDVNLLLHQGYSRELIFYLVIANMKITVAPKDGAAGIAPRVIYNDPSDPENFRQFKYFIKEAMEHGLTTESFLSPDDTGSAADDAASSGKPHKPRLADQADLCYDKALAIPNDVADIAAGSFCGDKPDVRTSAEDTGGPLYVTLHDASFPLHDQRLKIDVTTRSIYEIYYYLGRIIGSGRPVSLQAFDLPAEKIEGQPLVDVMIDRQVTGHPSADCFSTVRYENVNYCVPTEGAENTKRIFGILNALIALKQSTGDIPVTTTVHIAQ
jgi:hypothetical protein